MKTVPLLPIAAVALPALLAGCAATTDPSPPPVEILLVVNGGENSLTLVPIDSLRPTRKIGFGSWPGRSEAVAARGRTAVVTGGESDVVFVVDLRSETVTGTIALPPGSHPTGAVLISESVAYVTNRGNNTATRIDLETGDTASVAAGQYPIDVALARGRVFVVNANLGPCDDGPTCPLGPSWITVIDPITNTRLPGGDSIPLPEPGRARSAAVGGDGLIYVVNVGDPDSSLPGRLSIIDPIRREEVGSFGGFGELPVGLATDGGERLFVTSLRDGLMEFNTRTRRVVRGAGAGVLVNNAITAGVDSHGRVYAIESGDCLPGSVGRLRMFRSDLTEARSILTGECPTDATVVLVTTAEEQADPL
ncbi:MAG: YncE family protein [Gemmatimonadales bacterium]